MSRIPYPVALRRLEAEIIELDEWLAWELHYQDMYGMGEWLDPPGIALCWCSEWFHTDGWHK